jgi:hypothetical protein
MERTIQHYLAALDRAKLDAESRIAHLEAEGRQDEADLEKIRRNVLAHFAKLAQQDALKGQQEGTAGFARVHAPRFEATAEPWRQRQQKAAAHGDVVAQTIEETKLKTLRQIWAFYQQTEGKG